jgi:hypothetical protein
VITLVSQHSEVTTAEWVGARSARVHDGTTGGTVRWEVELDWPARGVGAVSRPAKPSLVSEGAYYVLTEVADRDCALAKFLYLLVGDEGLEPSTR